ncbi:nucleotide pyrophosphohydrolase [Clostridium acetobutylicum]|nr:nucleotide pyrophosphohydrolase [Clostridium acetobutylicum]
MKINELVKEAYNNAFEHGFWDDFKTIQSVADDIPFSEEYRETKKTLKNNAICTRLMLITGEVAEAMEGLRKNDMNNFKEELADVAIRLGDLCGGLGFDLEEEIKKKMEINKSREYKHGKAF